jgi:hypothetical protein
MRGRLNSRVVRLEQLAPDEKDRMYALLAEYFMNVTRTRFEQDLVEKEWIFLLKDTVQGQVRGFSTLMRLHIAVDGQHVVAFFSGDTIIQKEYWGDTELLRLWIRHVFELIDNIQDARVYWFLICSGYKTYRFLPIFFKEFYPTYKRATPSSVKRLLEALALQKFSSEYDPEHGVVRFAEATPLRLGVAEVNEQRLKDPHVAFFVAANPGHIHGDELACLVELTIPNLTNAGRRMLGLPPKGSR